MKPAIVLKLESSYLTCASPCATVNFGVWLKLGRKEHRLLGTEGFAPDKFLDYWQRAAKSLNIQLKVHPFVRAVVADFRAGDKKYSKYIKLWVKKVVKGQKKQ